MVRLFSFLVAALIGATQAPAATVSGTLAPGELLTFGPSALQNSDFIDGGFYASIRAEFDGPVDTGLSIQMDFGGNGRNYNFAYSSIVGATNIVFQYTTGGLGSITGPIGIRVGTLGVNSLTLDSLFISDGVNEATLYSFDNSSAVVPLPLGGLLLPAGLGAFAVRRRRRGKA